MATPRLPGIVYAMALMWLLAGCATLRTADLPPGCADDYNACLDGCPEQAAPGSPANRDLDFDTPACVHRCNEAAKVCR